MITVVHFVSSPALPFGSRKTTMYSNDLPLSIWKPELFHLQQQAPRPRKVTNNINLDRPIEFSDEYHGSITCREAEAVLLNEGDYLIRKSRGSPPGVSTLSFRVVGKVHHYKLYFDGEYYVKDKRFSRLEDLVAEGLLVNFMENKCDALIHSLSQTLYSESPHVTLFRRSKSQFSQHSSPHSFKVHNFKGFNWCERCGHFLWGFSAQGVKCKNCGFSAHHKCSQNVPNDCTPSLKLVRGVFGTDLSALVEATKPSKNIPWIVTKCVEEMERRGLNVEGLYRVSGYTDEIEDLRNRFENEREKADISESSYENIHVIAGVLKLFFRHLPIPLITFSTHSQLVDCVSNGALSEQHKVNEIGRVLRLLPFAHFSTLRYLIKHLCRVINNSVTKMTASNMATVFAPTLMPAAFQDISTSITSLELIIVNEKNIFLYS